jgi:hypothetical protein
MTIDVDLSIGVHYSGISGGPLPDGTLHGCAHVASQGYSVLDRRSTLGAIGCL